MVGGSLLAATMPDFRYPKTVAKTAESDLKAALKSQDGEGAVDALVRYSLAWSMISEEHLTEITTRIEQVANQSTTPADIRALLLHLDARVCYGHPSHWLDLSQRIDSLCRESLRDLEYLAQCPLTQYGRIIDLGSNPDSQEAKEGLRLLPTLAEFLLYHTREIATIKYSAEQRRYLQPLRDKQRADSIELARVERERQYVTLRHPELQGSRDSLKVEIRYRNLQRAGIEILALDDALKNKDDWNLPRKQLKDYAVTEVQLDDVRQDMDLVQQVTLPPLPYGQYVMSCIFTDREGKKHRQERFYRHEIIRVTDIEEVSVSLINRKSRERKDTQYETLLLDRMTGRPLSPSDLNSADTNYEHRSQYQSFGTYQDTAYSIQPITDRGLYRPGETVHYTAILQGNTAMQRHLLGHCLIMAELQDTESRQLMRDTLVTDEFGQVKGSFLLPTNERTGRFRIQFSAYRFGQPQSSLVRTTHYFAVSEYKAPTFDIDLRETPSRVSAADSSLWIRGQVMTFSGVPVAGRDVQLTFSQTSWWRVHGDGTPISQHTVQTDGEGRFALWLKTLDLVGRYPAWHTYLQIEASCTNAGGETQTSQHQVLVEGDPDNVPEGTTEAAEPVLTRPSQLTRDMIPEHSVLWIHDMFSNAKADAQALVRIGTSVPEAHIYYIVSDALGALDHGWLHYAETGLHDFTYAMPQSAGLGENPSDRDLTIQFLAMYEGKITNQTCHFTPADAMDDIHIARVTFRDHLIPGQPETWTFRIAGQRLSQSRQSSRLMLGLYDHALDKIEPFTWRYAARMAQRGSPSFDFRWSYGWDTSQTQTYRETLHLLAPRWPELNLYGGCFFDVRTKSRGPVLYDALVADDAEANFIGVDVSVMGYGVQRSIASASKGVVAESAAVEEEATFDPQTAASSLASVKMREGQKRLALWEPMLTTDSLGQVSITFEVPDQNTTWRLQALALSPWGSFAKIDTTLLAQRPLMVQPSLPRFVRQGDSLSLSGLVLNATEVQQQVTAMVEVYNPRTQQMVAQRACQLRLGASDQKPVEVSLCIPDTLEQLAYRIRAIVEGGEYGGFGDGEQRLLPVLPAVSPVIETIPFYLDPGAPAQTIVLPDSLPEGADIQLEWCDNPVVYCLEALPSLMKEVYPTSSSLAHRLFAYALSEKIVHRYPEVMGDSLLVELAKLQNPDGGFSWIHFQDRYSSTYATAEVLELIGELRQLDALPMLAEPNDSALLASMTERALAYYDKQMTDYYYGLPRKARKHLDCSYFSHYLYLRSLFTGEAMQSRAKKLYREALKQSRDRWGELDLAGRGYVALAMHRQADAKNQRLAADIVESLRQFSLTHPKRGMYWDQLEYSGYRWLAGVSQTSLLLQAFATIDPHNAELDQIRKWLLLEKQTTNWGSSSMAADAVYALLKSGTEWGSGEAIDSLHYDAVNDRLLLRDTLSLLQSLPSTTRRVEVPAAAADHPSWGAVYMRYAAPTRSAQAASNDEIALRKELLDAQGHVLSLDALAADSTLLHVGDQVTVRLRILTTRNMSEVQITDERSSCLEPEDQLSGYRWGGDVGYYLEPLDQRTVIFIPNLPRGEHWITYKLRITSPGQFALGLANVQCQYAPMFNAHTEGRVIRVSLQ